MRSCAVSVMRIEKPEPQGPLPESWILLILTFGKIGAAARIREGRVAGGIETQQNLTTCFSGHALSRICECTRCAVFCSQ